MLRAVRFAAKLEFEIEEGTRAAIAQSVHEINRVSRERIGEEMRSMLEHSSRGTAVKLLSDTSLLYKVWPDIWRSSPAAWLTVSALAGRVSRAIGLAAIQVDLWEKAVPRPWGEREWSLIARLLRDSFVLSNDEYDVIAWIGVTAEILFDWKGLTRAAFKRRMASPHWEAALGLHKAWLRDAAAFALLEHRVREFQTEGVAPEPFVTGDTLIQMGATPGPKFRGWLDALYDRQLELELKTKEEALAAARALIAS